MNVEEAITYLTKHHIIVKEDKSGYTITNAQNVILRTTEKAIIRYALELKNPPKVISLVGELHKAYWR